MYPCSPLSLPVLVDKPKPALLVSHYNGLFKHTNHSEDCHDYADAVHCVSNVNKSCKWSWFKTHMQPCALVWVVVVTWHLERMITCWQLHYCMKYILLYQWNDLTASSPLPWKKGNIATSLQSSLFIPICSVSARTRIGIGARRKYLKRYCVKRGLPMYSRLSTSVAKKRHLNQEWQQVPRSEEDKEEMYFSPVILQTKAQTYDWEIAWEKHIDY